MTVCIRITDRAKDSNGNVVCQNRAVLFGKVRWGKIVFYEVYENTEKVKALDEYPPGRGSVQVQACPRRGSEAHGFAESLL